MIARGYVKRLCMRTSLADVPRVALPAGYELIAWSDEVLEAHAEIKFRSFRHTLDSAVFPALARSEGCVDLMWRIRSNFGFVAESTWLVGDRNGHCGCIQGVELASGSGMIQNLAVLPEHRGLGLGAVLLSAALRGFREQDIGSAELEVSATNLAATGLYKSFGFETTKTIYRETREDYREYAI